jgi:6-phosphofructokinase 2
MQTIVTHTVNPTIDTSSAVDCVVAERKLRCERPRHEPGGGGVNVSRAIKRLGGESIAIFPVGGPTGKLLQDMLDQEGVQQHPIPIADWTRENFNVLDESSHRQFRFIMPGARMTEGEYHQCLEAIASLQPAPAYVVASGSLPPGVPDNFYARLARLVKKRGGKLVLDARGEPLRQALEEGVYLIKPNLREMCQLVGREVAEEPQQAEAALSLIHKKQCEHVVVSLGAVGALLASAEGTIWLRAPSVMAKSTVGAGDSMVGAIVLGLARGMTPRVAVRYGIAVGSATVMNPGTALCRREDAERLFNQMV